MRDGGRPALHFTPTRGWINDPHGVTFDRGRYHLFFQHVPGRTEWSASCRWGHAVSRDLLSWQEQPVALEPAADELGCWTGALVNDPGGAQVFYTSVREPDVEVGLVRRARPRDDDWQHWQPAEVVAQAPEDPPLTRLRDPIVTRSGGGWQMLVAATVAEVPALLSWRSPDLERWTYDGVAARGGSGPTPMAGIEDTSAAPIWECPQLVDLEGHRVLIASVWDAHGGQHVEYAGVDDTGRPWAIGPWRRLTYGGQLYAATTFRDAVGRWCMLAWWRGVADASAGWAGALSAPYELAFEDGLLRARPHPVLTEQLRWWTPAPGAQEVTVETTAGQVNVLARAGRVEVRSGGHERTVPHRGGPVAYLTDGPLLELFTSDGVLAVQAGQ